MQIKPLLQCLTVLGVLTLGGAQKACAQEDENWYQARLKQQRQLSNSPVVRSQQKQVVTAQRSDCDLSINGDMETQRTAPTRTGNMGGQLTGANVPDELVAWFSPTYATPDYLATNATSTGINVNPQQELGVTGSSTVRSGIGEIGLYSRQQFYDTDGSDRDRVSEYATGPLATAAAGLENGQYYAETWVSLSHATGPCNYGVTSGFGMWFTQDDSFKTLQNNFRDFLPLPTTKFISNSSPIGANAINNGNLGPTTWQRISGQFAGNGEKFVTIGLFNSSPSNQVLLPGKDASRLNTYVFVDDFQLYKIPTAGPDVQTGCGSVTIGEGCAIPGATYSWSNGATTLFTQVSPSTPTVYTLTVTLPDNSTYATSVTVSPGGTVAEAGYVLVHADDCGKIYTYELVNANPAFTYTVNRLGPAAVLTAHPTAALPTFRIKGGGGTTYGAFSVTVNAPGCGSSTTEPESFSFEPCPGPTPIYRTAATTAYPNPATESLALPEGAQDAVLLDKQGNAVQRTNKEGKLDVSTLPEGLYNLQMWQDGKLINQRIQVQH